MLNKREKGPCVCFQRRMAFNPEDMTRSSKLMMADLNIFHFHSMLTQVIHPHDLMS